MLTLIGKYCIIISKSREKNDPREPPEYKWSDLKCNQIVNEIGITRIADIIRYDRLKIPNFSSVVA